MTIQTLEQQIVAEYGKLTGIIAVHPKLSVLAAFLVGLGAEWARIRIFGWL